MQYALALAAVTGAVVLTGSIRRGQSGIREQPAVAASVPVLTLRGQAAPVSWQAIQDAHPAGAGRYLVIVLRAADCFTCEDLGRQLRELRHARGSTERAVLLVTPVEDRSVVRSWLRRERIAGVPVVSVDGGFQLVGFDSVPTPAVLLLDTSGNIERGIAHPQRVPNVRQRSFATELDLME